MMSLRSEPITVSIYAVRQHSIARDVKSYCTIRAFRNRADAMAECLAGGKKVKKTRPKGERLVDRRCTDALKALDLPHTHGHGHRNLKILTRELFRNTRRVRT